MSELVPEIEREHAHRAVELEERDPIFGRVAIVITLTTLLAAATGYLERVAATNHASADRNARVYAIRAVGTAIQADVMLGERRTLRTAFVETRELSNELAQSKESYAQALSSAYAASARKLQTLANGFFGQRYAQNGGFDSLSFVQDQDRPRYAAAEWQQAYANQRGSWASKRGGLIFGISVFAVALFLLGLTLTVPASSRHLFFRAGCLFAAGATGYVLYTWAGTTNTPSRAAVVAFARAEAALDAGAPNRDVVAAASTAIEHKDDYQQAYTVRGEAHLGIAFAAAGGPVTDVGPRGTVAIEATAARDDLRRAAQLDKKDYFAWVNLAEALFLLQDDKGALVANSRAFELEPARPVVNLDRVFLHAVTGDASWPAMLDRVVTTSLLRAPLSARDGGLANAHDLVELSLHRFAKATAPVRGGLVTLGTRLAALQARFDPFPPSYGNPGVMKTPASNATLSGFKLALAPDLSELDESFSVDGVVAGERLLFFLYVNGTHTLTDGPYGWNDPRLRRAHRSNIVPHQFQPNFDFRVGDRVVTEVYVQGNLRARCTLTVDFGDLPASACKPVRG